MSTKKYLTRVQGAILLGIIVVAAVIGGVYFYYFQQPVQPKVIQIGFVSEMSGMYSYYGDAVSKGAQVAVDEINRKGGVLGSNISLNIQDDKTDSQQTLASALLLDTQYKVPILTGPTSSDTGLAIADYAESHQIPLLTPIANHPGITKPGNKWTFKTQMDGVSIGATAARFILSLKKNARLAIVSWENALGRQTRAGFSWEVQREAGNLVSDKVVPPTLTEFAAVVASIKLDNPDYVYQCLGGVPGVNLYKELLNAGYKSNQIVYSYSTLGVMQSLGPLAQGLYFTLSWDKVFAQNITKAADFVKAFTAKWGVPPEYIAACGYVAIQAIAAAIQKAGSIDRTKIRDALHQISVDTIFPKPLSYDNYGNGLNLQLIVQNKMANSTYWDNTLIDVVYWQTGSIPFYQLAGVGQGP